MTVREKPPEELVTRAFEKGVHVGPPWCGTVYCPVCLHATFADLGADDRTVEEIAAAIRELRSKPEPPDERAMLERIADFAELGLELTDALGREGR